MYKYVKIIAYTSCRIFLIQRDIQYFASTLCIIILCMGTYKILLPISAYSLYVSRPTIFLYVSLRTVFMYYGIQCFVSCLSIQSLCIEEYRKFYISSHILITYHIIKNFIMVLCINSLRSEK